MPFNGKVLKVQAMADYHEIDLTQRELAELARVSLSTVKHYDQTKLKDEANEIALKKCDINDFGAMATELYMSKAKTPLEAIGIAYGSLMRFEYGLLKHLGKAKGLVSIGVDVVEATRFIVTRKSGEANIYSRKGVGKRLIQATNYNHIDKLFYRRKGWKEGNSEILWSLTELAREILTKAVKITLQHTQKFTPSDKYEIAPYLVHYIVPITSPTKVQSKIVENSGVSSVVIPLQSMENFSLESVFLTYTMSTNLSTDGFIVPLEHLGKSDETLGRVYHYFTMIRSFERQSMGWTAYDISAAMQTIALQLIGNEGFPLLSKYSADTTYKKAIRQQIADDTTLSVDEVKQTLTAYSNGSTRKIKMHPLLDAFAKESSLLMRKTMQHIADIKPKLLSQSRKQSTKAGILPDEVDWITDSTNYRIERAKSSVFFFVWTWYERKIRQSMMKLLPDGIELHDAVYSQLDVNIHDIESRVLEDTGFTVTIEKE